MAAFPMVLVAVCIIIATLLKKSAQNEADARRKNQKVDGMSVDDMRTLAFGQEQASAKKQSKSVNKPANKPVNKPVKSTPSKNKPLKNVSNDYKKGAESSVKKLEEDILSRSVHNAGEDFNDDTIKESADKHEFCSAPHFEETEDLNKTVRDLIVFGPNCKMSYERDFIAEGEKMLNLSKG